MTRSLAEATSPNLPPDVFLKHYRKVREAKRAKEEASAALARVNKAAKADGVDLDAFKLLEKFRDLDDDELGMRMRHVRDYAKWLNLPLGTQLTMFAEEPSAEVSAKGLKDQSEWEAGDQGYRAGRSGSLRSDNPYDEGTEPYVAWDKEWTRGVKSLAAEMRGHDDAEADRKIDERAAAAPRKRGRPRKTDNGAHLTHIN